jgi:antitoxin HigA-1
METQAMSGSRTITKGNGAAEDNRLDNVHPGDILRYDYLIGSEIPVAEVVAGAGVAETRLLAILEARLPVDADTDLRLSRYFGVSEGMFLGLQIDYDIEEAKRSLNGSLDRIIPRAA